jgi:hypothetical protein
VLGSQPVRTFHSNIEEKTDGVNRVNHVFFVKQSCRHTLQSCSFGELILRKPVGEDNSSAFSAGEIETIVMKRIEASVSCESFRKEYLARDE